MTEVFSLVAVSEESFETGSGHALLYFEAEDGDQVTTGLRLLALLAMIPWEVSVGAPCSMSWEIALLSRLLTLTMMVL